MVVGWFASVSISVGLMKSNGFVLLQIVGIGVGGMVVGGVQVVVWFVLACWIMIFENSMRALSPAVFDRCFSSECRMYRLPLSIISAPISRNIGSSIA